MGKGGAKGNLTDPLEVHVMGVSSDTCVNSAYLCRYFALLFIYWFSVILHYVLHLFCWLSLESDMKPDTSALCDCYPGSHMALPFCYLEIRRILNLAIHMYWGKRHVMQSVRQQNKVFTNVAV